MKNKIIVAFIIFTMAIISCNTGNIYKTNQSLLSFKKAQKEGNINIMCKSFKSLIQSGIIKNGMTQEDVLTILGKGDNFTGIYVPGGISIGFNKKIKPTAKNYFKFYWIHFKEMKKNNSEKYYLINTDSCD